MVYIIVIYLDLIQVKWEEIYFINRAEIKE